jgi:hypothetical protein
VAIRELQGEYQGINCNRNIPLLDYAYDVVISSETELNVHKATKSLIRSKTIWNIWKKLKLIINESKTKLMLIGRERYQIQQETRLQVVGIYSKE